MQVREQHLTGAEHGPLRCLGFLHLDDHVGGGEHLGRGVVQGRSRRGVVGVGRADADPGVSLDHDLVAVGHQLPDARGREPDASLCVLDLAGHSDTHGPTLRPHGHDGAVRW